jgi:hypothetical protein
VTPYDFFVGIGDINSSFLPKPELKTCPKAATVAIPDPNKDLAEGAEIKEPEPINGDGPESSTQKTQSPSGNVSALEQLVSMGGGMTQLHFKHKQVSKTRHLQRNYKIGLFFRSKSNWKRMTKRQRQHQRMATIRTKVPRAKRHRVTLASIGIISQDNDTELQYLERSLREVHEFSTCIIRSWPAFKVDE